MRRRHRKVGFFYLMRAAGSRRFFWGAMDSRYRITMMLTDSTAVCGPADFSLKDEANRKKLKNFIIEQLYPDDPDGWRAALSVFAVPVWNRFETVWYAPQEIVGFAPKIRKFSEYSTVQQNHIFKCRLYEVLQDLSSRAGAFTAVTGEQRLLVSCLSDPAGVFGLGRAMYFDPEKDLYVINDRNPVIIRWGVISEGGNPEPLLQKFFSTCGSDNSQEKTAPGDDFASEGAKFSSSGSESAAPETEPGCTNNGSDSATTETDPGRTFNRSVDRNSKPKGKTKVFSSRRPQKEKSVYVRLPPLSAPDTTCHSQVSLSLKQSTKLSNSQL